MRRPGDTRGFATAGSLVGVLLSLVAVLVVLTLCRGTLGLAADLGEISTRAASAHWALDRMVAEVSRAGAGLPAAGAESSPDEAVELLDSGALGIRGDLDAADPALARDPEEQIAGIYPRTTTGNDEVVIFYRRTGSRGGRLRARFEADLDSSDRITLADGSELARRDGVVESIDAGPFTDPGDARAGTLYRVTFVHDARRAGTGRFRIVQPLIDDVVLFEVTALDGQGTSIAPCGGADDSASRACRGRVRRVRLTVEMKGGGRFEREIALEER
ncbi:MAG TPA: hypothetical protein ENK10_08560 [Acidobacteria bacterium]|nr:hypothetical protein [Acidobacteriota bacterium]